jgi:hypothetical protein
MCRVSACTASTWATAAAYRAIVVPAPALPALERTGPDSPSSSSGDGGYDIRWQEVSGLTLIGPIGEDAMWGQFSLLGIRGTRWGAERELELDASGEGAVDD